MILCTETNKICRSISKVFLILTAGILCVETTVTKKTSIWFAQTSSDSKSNNEATQLRKSYLVSYPLFGWVWQSKITVD